MEVKLSSSTNPDYESIAQIFSFNITNRIGTFNIIYTGDEIYKIIDLVISENLSLYDNDIIIIFDEHITPLYEGMIKIKETVYVFHIYNETNRIKIPVRIIKSNDAHRTSFSYSIAKYHKTNNFLMSMEVETLTFSSPQSAFAFIIPYFSDYTMRNYPDILLNSYTPYDVKKYYLNIDYNYLLVTVTHENPNVPNELDFVYTLITINNNQLKISYNTTFMKKLFPNDEMEYKIHVNSLNPDGKFIRYNENISSYSNYMGVLAVFTFKNFGVFDFYVVCTNEKGSMCELNYSSQNNESEYHLIKFPSRNGINITGSGMHYGFINVKHGENVSYYKSDYGSLAFIRSYGSNNIVKIEVDDFENSNFSHFENDDIDGYRRFCLKDNNENIIPFSNKYISENLSILMHHFGAKNAYNISQYDLTDDDCIIINLNQIETNKIKYAPNNVCDIPVNISVIPIIMKNITYFPLIQPTSKFSNTLVFSQSIEFSNSNEFTNSDQFTNSKLFTFSKEFSQSEEFSNLKSFTGSFEFTNSNIFHSTPSQSKFGDKYSLSIQLTYSYVKTVSFSASYFNTYCFTICISDEENIYSFCPVETQTYKYFPYIIYSLSPKYTQVSVLINVIPKKKISQAQLIGIICGSCAVVFSIAGIAVLIVNMKYRKKGISIENISETTSLIDATDKNGKETNFDHKNINQHNIDDAWL